MIDKNDLYILINDITWSYEECGEKVPLNILNTLDKIKQLQVILNEYNITSENIREVLLTGQMFKDNPILKQCINKFGDNFGDELYKLSTYKDMATPKKPKTKVVYYNCRGEYHDSYIDYRCPVCGFGCLGKNWSNYCPCCSQAIDWSDKNDK